MVNLSTVCIYVILKLLRLHVIDNLKKALAVARRESMTTSTAELELVKQL